jgi:hypothetical protein
MRYEWLYICLLILFPQQAFALCVLPVISGLPSTSTFSGSGGEYNIYDPAEYLQSVNFSVDTVASVGGFRYFLVLSAGHSGSAPARQLVLGTDTLNYNVYTTAAKSNVINTTGIFNAAGTLSDSFSFILGLLQSKSHTLYWTIPPLQVVKSNAARFQDVTLSLSLYGELALGIFTLADTKTITFRSRVESNVDLSLVDTGGALDTGDTSQTLNFGTLSSGQILSYDTVIRSNSGYILSLQSQRGQKLAHQNYPTVAATIPYTLTVGGNAVNLTSGSIIQAASSTGVSSAAGTRLQTKFTIGNLSGAEPTGIYQDVITVTISAN